MFGRIDIVPYISQPAQGPTPATTTTTTTGATTTPAPVNGIWTPSCDDFLKTEATTLGGATTAFTIQTTSGFGKRDTPAPANPEVIGGAVPTAATVTTKSSGTTVPSAASGSGSSYQCTTTTRAEQLMDLCLFNLAREGISPSEVCTGTGGPGIFAPVHSARFFMACSVGIFNGWAVYDPVAKPVRSNNPPQKRVGVLDRTTFNKEVAMTYSLFQVLTYILPNRRQDVKTSLLNAYGLDMDNPVHQSAVDGIAAGQDFVDSYLSVDGSNQVKCYADTSGFVPTDDPVQLDSFQTVNASLAKRKFPLKWADVKWTGHVVARKYLTPHAGNIARVVLTSPEVQASLQPTKSPLPSPQQLDQEMQFLTDVQRDLNSDNGRKKLQAHFWADGPRTTLPPGHMMEVIQRAVARPKRYSLDQAVRMYLLAGVSVYEAGLWCWTWKRQYQTIRPGEYIPLYRISQTLKSQYVGPYCPYVDIQGWRWIPYQILTLNTPPFPEFPSGHSSFSSAVMTTMALFTGSDTLPATLSYPFKKGNLGYKFGTEPHCFKNGTTFDGSACTYSVCSIDGNYTSETNFSPISDGDIGPFFTFSSIALSAGYSRLYGGIHPSSGNFGGLSLGSQVGQLVYRNLCENYIGVDQCLGGRENIAAAFSPVFALLAAILTVLIAV